MYIKRKLFYKKELSYYKPFDRAKEVSKYGLSGFVPGALVGSGIGAKLSPKGNEKVGALIGAGIGGALGAFGFGKLGMKMTSKEYIDQVNDSIRRSNEREKEIKKNPRLLFKDLEDDVKIIQDFKKLESKYKMKFPDQFYKYIKLRKQFIPTLVNLYKKYKNSIDLWSLILGIDKDYTEAWIKENIYDNNSVGVIALLYDKTRADDTWITYDTDTKKFGYDIDQNSNNFNSLKEVLLDYLESELELVEYAGYGIDPEEQRELITIFSNFIKNKL